MAFSLRLSVIYMACTVVAGAHMIELNVSGLRNHSEARKLNAAESGGEPVRGRGRERIPHLYPQYLRLTPTTGMH